MNQSVFQTSEIGDAEALERPIKTPGKTVVDCLLESELLEQSRLGYAHRVLEKLDEKRPLLGVVVDLGLVSMADVHQAIRRQCGALDLGAVLVELGHLREAELNGARELLAESSSAAALSSVLLDKQLVSESVLAELLADVLDVPFVEPRIEVVDQSLVQGKNLHWCFENEFIPLEIKDGRVLMAFTDPSAPGSFEQASKLVSSPIDCVVARRSKILELLRSLENINSQPKTVSVGHATAADEVAHVIDEAAEAGASDVHFESTPNGIRVRMRLDGAMFEHSRLDRSLTQSVISRLKVLAGADIAERRRHQDGRLEFESPRTGQRIDVRVSFYVTVHGEKVVLRLLHRKDELINISDIGMAPKMLERFVSDALDVPTGVVIVSGPTGSGKTTTLYSCVDYLNSPDRSIVTAEDPVEYIVDGIAQCSMNSKIGLTYEETLRHIVRQDPDVIVLGEIRDKFSADVAIQAALTGHKVLTTFHTEDSIGGLLRLLNMNIETFLISSTVVSVVAQRLLRKVCVHCAEPYTPSAAELRKVGHRLEEFRGTQLQLGRGCSHCRYTGYKGRICVFELLVLNEQVKDAILEHKTSHEIRRISVETTGLITLFEDGLYKASLGLTSLKEVIRNLPRVMRPRHLSEIERLSRS